MNISSTQTSTDTQQTPQITEKSAVSESNKTQTSAKTEEKTETKDTTEKSEFQKFLEEPQSTDKISLEQAMPDAQLLNQQNGEFNGDYANKFSFDVVSGFNSLKPTYNYDSMSISKEDAKFFVDMVENKQFAVQQDGDKMNLIKFSDEVGPTYKAQQTSQVLTDLISKAYNEQKPVRIDFDNNVSVILKIDTKGKVTAEFIPGDKAVEAYLKNNIGFLKQRFDEQNLSYNDIFYRQSNNRNQNRERQQQRQDKGE